MGQRKVLPGRIAVELTSADIPALLNTMTAHNIKLSNIQYRDALTLRVAVSRQSMEQLVLLAERQGAFVKIIGALGALPVVGRLLRRPVLTIFILAVFLMTCYIPGRIFFICVEGNETIPERYILEAAAECGIDFGAKRRAVRSEIMKNRLLEKIPQLQWAGINTNGCTAVISVREKTAVEKQQKTTYSVSSIVASRDGVIQSCTVFQGNALCAVGQAVKAGQTLVSGYLDCGIVTKTTHAEAEIKALTFRDIEVVAPASAAIKGQVQNVKTRYGLKIGKNLIKFYKDSGNLDTTCGKIYSEEYVYLPGGFCLPVAIVKETQIVYDSDSGQLPTTENGQWLELFAKDYLKAGMISGEIITADAEVIAGEGVFRLRGRYTCMEMIGRTKREETIPKDDVK